MSSKQVLVMKRFPGLRLGKYIAQGSHACLGAVFSMGRVADDGQSLVIPLTDPFVKEWITGSFKKVVVYVKTDEELTDVYQKAVAAGLVSVLIKDAGLTEFNGVATLTAVGIGPASSAEIDKITGKLPLF